MLKATANIAIKTCHFPKLAPVLLVWTMGVGLEVQGRPPHLKLFPWESICSGGLDTRLFQELGLEQERKLAESLSPEELTHLGRKDNSMRQRHTPSRASGCEVTDSGWEVTGADFPKVAQMPH